jgi:hypothetical protein
MLYNIIASGNQGTTIDNNVLFEFKIQMIYHKAIEFLENGVLDEKKPDQSVTGTGLSGRERYSISK